MRFHYSKGYIVSCLFFILGLYFCLDSLYTYYLKSTAIPIETLNSENCKVGKYVYGDIASYVVAAYDTPDGKAYNGVSAVIASWNGQYAEYTVPIADNCYIRFLTASQNTINVLHIFSNLQQQPYYMEGRVVKSEVGLNEGFYEHSEQFRNVDYHDAIIEEFCIQEISFDSYMFFDRQVKKWETGIPLLFISFILFLLSGGVRNLVPVQNSTANEGPTDKKIRFSHRTQYELEEERQHLSALYSRLDGLKRSCLFRLPLLLAGVWLFLAFDHTAVRMLGIAVLFLFFLALLQYFLNANMQAALLLNNLFHLKSVWQQIMESSKRVQILQSLMDENAASKNELSDIK